MPGNRKPAAPPRFDPAKPFAGWVVRLIDTASWKDDAIVNVLRRYGAKVVYRDTRTTTHIVTTHAPPAREGIAGWMTYSQYGEFKRAVAFAAEVGRPVLLWSYAQVTDALDQMHEDRRVRKEAVRAAAYVTLDIAAPEMPGFVGV